MFKTSTKYFDYVKYLEYIAFSNRGNSKDFVPITSSQTIEYKEGDPRLIVYYLPQFHQVEVNNQTLGQGFTEWTNSSRAKSLFTGHYQPNIPYDVGYYDLSHSFAINRQAYLANLYGIYGFCYHFYWYNNQPIMNTPIELLAAHKKIKIRYCINIVMENWTSNWDGSTGKIIFRSRILTTLEIQRLANYIVRYLKDNRYIKEHKQPIVSFYCPQKTYSRCEFCIFIERFKKYLKTYEINPYILITTGVSFNFGKPSEWNANAILEYSRVPSGRLMNKVNLNDCYVDPSFNGKVYDLSRYIQNHKYLTKFEDNNYIRSVLVSWDNTPRNPYSGIVLLGLTPSALKAQLVNTMLSNYKTFGVTDKMIFINSWNEWAEGMYLEPDYRYGYARLQAVQDSLNYFRKEVIAKR